MKVTITNISRKERTSKAGKPYTSLGLQTQEHGEKWISGFDGKETKNWKVGDTVEVDVVPNGQYLNFSVPKLPAGYTLANTEIQKELNIIKDMLARIISIIQPVGKKDNYPEMNETNNGEY